MKIEDLRFGIISRTRVSIDKIRGAFVALQNRFRFLRAAVGAAPGGVGHFNPGRCPGLSYQTLSGFSSLQEQMTLPTSTGSFASVANDITCIHAVFRCKN